MSYQIRINKALESLKPSGIRRFFDIAAEMDDVISLSIGEPDFSTPWHIREEGIRSLQRAGRGTPKFGFAETQAKHCRIHKKA